ncbi:putative phosphoglycerate mutase [Nakamurella sp. UYEF19]|uniref:histidine phosphatase family protein n=1 Tax=Nakamurella sp. UYEF19 TaxID=1756392 RepID=UPI0033993E91
MRLIIVRHGETDWTLTGRYTGGTDLALTAKGRTQAAALAPVLANVLRGRDPVVVTSPRQRAIQTITLALPGHQMDIDPLVAEFDYGDYEGLTGEHIRRRAPGWDIWRDGCPHGESTPDVGTRADRLLAGVVPDGTQPLVVVTHGHFSRILAARAIGLAPKYGRLFASTTASVSLVEDHDSERCLGLCNADSGLLQNSTHGPTLQSGWTAESLSAAGDRPTTRHKIFATWKNQVSLAHSLVLADAATRAVSEAEGLFELSVCPSMTALASVADT